MTQTMQEKAYKEVNDELENAKKEQFKNVVREYKTEQLRAQEKWKQEKEHAEDCLRIIKLNLDNLDKGNFEAIEERIKKSSMARMLSDNISWAIPDISRLFNPNWTTGTFIIDINGRKKTLFF